MRTYLGNRSRARRYPGGMAADASGLSATVSKLASNGSASGRPSVPNASTLPAPAPAVIEVSHAAMLEVRIAA